MRQRLITTNALLPLLSEVEQGKVMRLLGEVWQLIGQWSIAEDSYRQALAIAQATEDQRAEAFSQTALGHLLSYTESYYEALILLKQAQTGFEQLGDSVGLNRTLEYLSFVYVQQGNYSQALICSEKQRQIASEYGDQIGLMMQSRILGLCITIWAIGFRL